MSRLSTHIQKKGMDTLLRVELRHYARKKFNDRAETCFAGKNKFIKNENSTTKLLIQNAYSENW